MSAAYVVPVLTDGAVRLRPVEERDDDRVLEACHDPETAFWLGQLPQPYRLADAQEWREHQHEAAVQGTRVPWVVADPATDECIGAVDLFAIREGWDAEIGYWAHPAARGRGLTAAACRLAMAHAFSPPEQGGLGLVRLQGVVAEGNEASARVLRRIGMQQAGTYRAFVLTRAGRVDGWLFDILRDDVRA